MNVTSIFDILGPVMIGPSSSHTAGAVRMGLLARAVFGDTPKRATITLFGSFAQTGRGHGTDQALLAGLLGFQPDDPQVRQAAQLVRERKLDYKLAFESELPENLHPNTVRFELAGDDRQHVLWGSSLGAGQVQLWQIDDARCELDGKAPALLIRHIDRPGLIGHVTTLCGKLGFNISRFSSLRDRPGGRALMTAIFDQIPSGPLLQEIRRIENVQDVRAVDALEPPRPESPLIIPHDFFDADVSADAFAEKIIALEAETTSRTTNEVRQGLERLLNDMSLALEDARRSDHTSASGLVGTEHVKWSDFVQNGGSLLGQLGSDVVRDALAMAAFNAKMGRIAAAPTAGSCGVLPAVLINLSLYKEVSKSRSIEALAVAGMIGAMIGQGASLSGAECGCQAECGSASAMAAGAAAYLISQSSAKILNAAGLALKNHLGLTCDPVAGLVEVPCVKRNAFAATASLLSCQLSAAGIESVIPFREIIAAMNQTGKMIPPALRESSEAGLAGTPAARNITRRLQSDS
jgi:L-serine dehydratase